MCACHVHVVAYSDAPLHPRVVSSNCNIIINIQVIYNIIKISSCISMCTHTHIYILLYITTAAAAM